MNTGTPLDLTAFGSVLHGIGLLYWFLVALILAAAITNAKGRLKKWLSAVVVLAIMVGPIAVHMWKKHEAQQQAKARLDTAMALFHEHCKSAGEKTYRTVGDVDGVVWMKWREPLSNADNFASQFKMNDPYGQDCGGEECIARLLRATEGLQLDPRRKLRYHQGYRFVESADPEDHQLYRYTLRLYRPADRDAKYLKTLVEPELIKEPISSLTAHYGITWDDISTHEDREH